MRFLLILLFLLHRGFCQPSASRYILDVAHYDLPDLETAEYRCVGTVITERHVLTTANCVIVEPSQGVAVTAKVSVYNLTEYCKTRSKSRLIFYRNFLK